MRWHGLKAARGGAANEWFGHGRMSSGEREWVEPSGALSDRDGSNLSRPGLSLLALSSESRLARRAGPQSVRGSRSRLAIKRSFCGVQLWPIVVAGTVSILVVGEESSSGPASPSCSAGDAARSTRRSGSGSQPTPSRRRSASFAISVFFRWSISCAAGSPFASRTASRSGVL